MLHNLNCNADGKLNFLNCVHDWTYSRTPLTQKPLVPDHISTQSLHLQMIVFPCSLHLQTREAETRLLMTVSSLPIFTPWCTHEMHVECALCFTDLIHNDRKLLFF